MSLKSLITWEGSAYAHAAVKCYINTEIAFVSNGPNTRLLHLNSGIQCHFNPFPMSHQKKKPQKTPKNTKNPGVAKTTQM